MNGVQEQLANHGTYTSSVRKESYESVVARLIEQGKTSEEIAEYLLRQHPEEVVKYFNSRIHNLVAIDISSRMRNRLNAAAAKFSEHITENAARVSSGPLFPAITPEMAQEAIQRREQAQGRKRLNAAARVQAVQVARETEIDQLYRYLMAKRVDVGNGVKVIFGEATAKQLTDAANQNHLAQAATLQRKGNALLAMAKSIQDSGVQRLEQVDKRIVQPLIQEFAPN
jgi:hypothetical protein